MVRQQDTTRSTSRRTAAALLGMLALTVLVFYPGRNLVADANAGPAPGRPVLLGPTYTPTTVATIPTVPVDPTVPDVTATPGKLKMSLPMVWAIVPTITPTPSHTLTPTASPSPSPTATSTPRCTGLVEQGQWSGTDVSFEVNGGPAVTDLDLYVPFRSSRCHLSVNGSVALGPAGMFVSIALDSSDRPHLAFYNAEDSSLHYAVRTEAGWQVEMVDDAGHVGQFASLALDADDHPHIAYYDSTNDDLKYAYWDGSSWHVETVDSTGSTGLHTDIALDSAGRPHISYYDETRENLRYARWDGSTWRFETPAATGDVGMYSAIALRSDGSPVILYYNADSQSTRSASKPYGSWTWGPVLTNVRGPALARIMVDDEDLVHALLTDADDTSATIAATYYATSRLTSGWTTEPTTGTPPGRPGFPSLAIDPDGRVQIAYVNSTGDLTWAVREGTSWSAETAVDVNNRDWVQYTDMAISSTGHTYIAYYDESLGAPRVAIHDGDVWQVETVYRTCGTYFYRDAGYWWFDGVFTSPSELEGAWWVYTCGYVYDPTSGTWSATWDGVGAASEQSWQRNESQRPLLGSEMRDVRP